MKGTPDGVFSGWTVYDSVGVLDDNTDVIDRAYGAINFINGDGLGESATGEIVQTGAGGDGYTANYVGRVGDSTGSTAADWVGADLDGTPPNLSLAGLDVTHPSLGNAPLDHIGSSNPVPEPASLAFAALGGLFLMRRRSR